MMRAATSPAGNPWTGSRWLPLSVSAVVIALLAGFLLMALADMEERAEAMLVALTVRNLRTGLTVAKGEALLAGEERAMAQWAGRNPIEWLAAPPAGYEGECRAAASPAAGGWCFDSTRRELRYRPRNAAHLALDSGARPEHLKWRVVVRASDADRQQIAVDVENLTPYRWGID